MKNILLFIAILSTAYCANAQYTKLTDFASVQGISPKGSLFYDGTYLYGMTEVGGANGKGIIFKINPNGTGFTTLLDFDGANGSYPKGSLVSDGTFLYGMTTGDGGVSFGNIFKIKPDGTGYANIRNFISDTTGVSTPYGSLFFDGTFLYGITNNAIFKIRPDGTGYSRSFTGGSNAFGSLISDGTFLYGMTRDGGMGNNGIIFKIKPDWTSSSILLDFSGANGERPFGDLVSDGTFLYGMTDNGGTSNFGVVFKIKTDGTGYSKLLDFTGANGAFTGGSLVFDGTFLYGMTISGGAFYGGTIFKIKTDGTGYSMLFDFPTAADGTAPLASLVSDGTSLYGMTPTGGAGCPDPMGVGGCGVIFKYQLATVGIVENNLNTFFTIYPNPSSGIFTVNLKNKTTKTDICIHDVLGNCVLDKGSVKNINPEIDLSSQPKGVYFMEIISEGEKAVKKIVLQ